MARQTKIYTRWGVRYLGTILWSGKADEVPLNLERYWRGRYLAIDR